MALRSFLTAVFILHVGLCDSIPHPRLAFIGPFSVEPGGAQNVNVEYRGALDGELIISYGPCGRSASDFDYEVGKTHIGEHPLARRHMDWSGRRPDRFVWLPPSDIKPGCLQAFLGGDLVGESEEFMVNKRIDRRGTFADYTDAVGPWFDGVEYLSQKEPDSRFVSSVKNKRFGILGAGISGLMTALLLDSVGIHNWQILESTGRIGGRLHTSYLNNTSPDEYQYQEMGAMRFPVEIKNKKTNETVQIMDFRMVFQLADRLNEMNNNATDLAVNFIPFYLKSANLPSSTTKRRLDGTVPTIEEVASNPAFATNTSAQYLNATAVHQAKESLDDWLDMDEERVEAIASNIFAAHKTAVETGHFDFSEAGYLRYALGVDRNTTDLIDSISSHDPAWLYRHVYIAATTWRTVDKGMNRLADAFWPLIKNRITLNTKVQGVEYSPTSNTVTVSHLSPNSTSTTPYNTTTFDYLINSIPFPILRSWRFTPPHSSLMTRAISRLDWGQACKVALHYRTRWWEHLPRPIHGGCTTTSQPQIGVTCYPSFNLNGTGPGVLLGSYLSASGALAMGGLSDADHAAFVQRAMVEIHGPVAADEFTGLFDRVCWHNVPSAAGGWAKPGVGQHPLYMPAYWQTEMNQVFVGEHTSVTHAWVFSSLESAVRGVVQLLLDQGLVDEAKEINRTWMARWISV